MKKENRYDMNDVAKLAYMSLNLLRLCSLVLYIYSLEKILVSKRTPSHFVDEVVSLWTPLIFGGRGNLRDPWRWRIFMLMAAKESPFLLRHYVTVSTIEATRRENSTKVNVANRITTSSTCPNLEKQILNKYSRKRGKLGWSREFPG